MHRSLTTLGVLVLFGALACETAHPTVAPPANPAPTGSYILRGDACMSDIPDCEAACAMREAGRTNHVEWFDRRCAAVVLGKNPDKAVAGAPVDGTDASAPPPSASVQPPTVRCDPPFSIDENGLKHWKRNCLD
jgi:hypothetical protein